MEDGSNALSNRELLMVSLIGRDDHGIRRKHEVDPWVWDQVGLQSIDIHVQSTIKRQ